MPEKARNCHWILLAGFTIFHRPGNWSVLFLQLHRARDDNARIRGHPDAARSAHRSPSRLLAGQNQQRMLPMNRDPAGRHNAMLLFLSPGRSLARLRPDDFPGVPGGAQSRKLEHGTVA